MIFILKLLHLAKNINNYYFAFDDTKGKYIIYLGKKCKLFLRILFEVISLVYIQIHKDAFVQNRVNFGLPLFCGCLYQRLR